MSKVPDEFFETYCKPCIYLQRVDEKHYYCARIKCPHMVAYLHAQEKKREVKAHGKE